MRILTRFHAAWSAFWAGFHTETHLDLQHGAAQLILTTQKVLSQEQRRIITQEIEGFVGTQRKVAVLSGMDIQVYVLHNTRPALPKAAPIEMKVTLDNAALKKALEHVASPAAIDVLLERARQIDQEGWTPEHDDEEHNEDAGLAQAAAAYTLSAVASLAPHVANMQDAQEMFPWELEFWKPGFPRRDLVKATALLIAQIEQIDRANVRASQEGGGA